MKPIEQEIKRYIAQLALLYLEQHPGDPEGAIKEFQNYQAITKEWIEKAIRTAAAGQRPEEMAFGTTSISKAKITSD